MSDNPFGQSTPQETPQAQAVTTNVAVAERPQADGTRKWMETIMESVAASELGNLAGGDPDYIDVPVFADDPYQIKILKDMGYEPNFEHHLNDEAAKRIVMRIKKEHHGKQYRVEAERASRALRVVDDKADEITGTEGRPRSQGAQDLKRVLDRMPENDADQHRIQAARMTIDGRVPEELLDN